MMVTPHPETMEEWKALGIVLMLNALSDYCEGKVLTVPERLIVETMLPLLGDPPKEPKPTVAQQRARRQEAVREHLRAQDHNA